MDDFYYDGIYDHLSSVMGINDAIKVAEVIEKFGLPHHCE